MQVMNEWLLLKRNKMYDNGNMAVNVGELVVQNGNICTVTNN